mmetsp:Transcript_2845/g.10865  ORF Transcript_2845/g.10865 Transcript_2845/m.10865 type:complete len:216 (+) Transcript_2845:1246-1893(+)
MAVNMLSVPPEVIKPQTSGLQPFPAPPPKKLAVIATTSCSNRATAGNASACSGFECAYCAYTSESRLKCFESATYTAPLIVERSEFHLVSFCCRALASPRTQAMLLPVGGNRVSFAGTTPSASILDVMSASISSIIFCFSRLTIVFITGSCFAAMNSKNNNPRRRTERRASRSIAATFIPNAAANAEARAMREGDMPSRFWSSLAANNETNLAAS